MQTLQPRRGARAAAANASPGRQAPSAQGTGQLALTLLGLSPRGRVPAPQHTEQPARDSERRKRLCSGPATRQSGCPRTRTPFRPLAAQAPTPIQTLALLGGQAVKSPLLRGTSEPIPLGAPACLGLGKAGIRGGRHSPWPFIRMLTRTEDQSALLTPTVCLENLPDAKARRHPPLKQAPRPQEGPTSPGSASSSPWLLNREAPAAPALSPALSNRSDDSSAQRVHCEQALQSTGMAGRVREVTRHRHTRTHTLLTHAYTRARLPSGPHKTARDTDREAPWAPPRPACPPRLHASVCFGFLYRQQNRQERNNKKTGFFTQI